MRILLILTLLAGCSSIHDNTTTVDKSIIGGTIAVILYSGAELVN